MAMVLLLVDLVALMVEVQQLVLVLSVVKRAILPEIAQNKELMCLVAVATMLPLRQQVDGAASLGVEVALVGMLQEQAAVEEEVQERALNADRKGIGHATVPIKVQLVEVLLPEVVPMVELELGVEPAVEVNALNVVGMAIGRGIALIKVAAVVLVVVTVVEGVMEEAGVAMVLGVEGVGHVLEPNDAMMEVAMVAEEGTVAVEVVAVLVEEARERVSSADNLGTGRTIARINNRPMCIF